MKRGLAARVAQVSRLARPPAWAAPAVVGLGLAAAALEGAGLYLFIPLMESLGASGGEHALSGVLDKFLAPVPANLRAAVIVVGLCMCIAGKNLMMFLGAYVARYLDGIVAHDLRTRIFDQTLTSCVDYRAGARMTDVVTTLANNTWKVSNALSLFYRLVICACTFLVFLALMLAISAPLTLLAIGMLGVAAGAIHLVTHRAQEAGRRVVEENKAFGLRMWESVGALQLIRSFARESHEAARFRTVSDRIRRRMLTLDMMWALPAPISEILGAALIGSLVVVGASSGAGLAPLAAFLAVLYRLQGPTREFFQGRVALEGLGAAIDDVDQFLLETAEPYIVGGKAGAPPLGHGLEFRAVSFGYGAGESLALDQVSFSIPVGKTTAFVGRSGAGKSTLMSLLFRFRDPVAGEILADGRRLQDFDLATWRARLSLMAQEPHIFNDSVLANIGYGDLAAGPEAIKEAARIAGADDFISRLPQGYATELGDRGARLSGGQRQRIALARTVLKNPEVLLLDEPTNALDVETEQAFQAALETFSAGRTVVVIAHRLSTVLSADQVIVFDGGRVLESGAPRDLLAQPGHFARLYGLQYAEPREVA